MKRIYGEGGEKMLTIVFFATTVICGLGWLTRHISCAVLFWYLEQRNIPFPSEKEMEEGSKWVVSHMAKDFFNRK